MKRLRIFLISKLIGKDIMVIANASIPMPINIDSNYHKRGSNGAVIQGIYMSPGVKTVRSIWETEELDFTI